MHNESTFYSEVTAWSLVTRGLGASVILIVSPQGTTSEYALGAQHASRSKVSPEPSNDRAGYS
jgi:hypothetical protein